MKLSLAEFLAHVKRISAKHSKDRISTADRYLVTLGKCTGGLCPTDRARYAGAEWEKRVKEAAQLPVYHNDRMNFLAFVKSGLKASDADTAANPKALAPVAEFEAVYTSTKEDRDRDILEAGGAELDARMPLLWQHDPTAPIGAHRETIAQDKHKVIGKSAIADIPLGRDAAYLAEFGALRISHGFKPKEFEPITEKSGSHEIVTGFHVTKYEMMEVSLVSVPSNTDAVIQAFSRGKLTSPLAKSWGKTLDESRQRVFTTGFGVKALKLPTGRTVVGIKRAAPTGKVKALVARKDAADFEKSLAEACANVVHSGDYGLCFYKAGETADTFAVWWTMGDADTPDQSNEEGQAFTSADDVKALLGAVPGVASVEIGPEANPPMNEGWREVYPEVRDWTDTDADKPQPATDGAAPAQSSEPAPEGDEGKGKKPKKKDGTPVAGSAEHVAQVLAESVGPYLSANGVQMEEGAEVAVQATYPDSVIVRVGAEGDGAVFFRVGYSVGADGNPTLSGTPEQVELQTVVTDAPKPDAPAADAPNAGDSGDPADGRIDGSDDPANAASTKPTGTRCGKKKPLPKWVPVSKVKGRLGKKDTSLLKEAQEHLEDAITRDGMPGVCKTLVKRGADLIGDVLKSDGTNQDQGQPDTGTAGDAPTAPAVLNAEERSLWTLIIKGMKSGQMSKTALAALMNELAMKLEGSDVAKLLETLK